MAPQRPRTGVDDSRSETSSTKEKQSIPAPTAASKNRRVASTNTPSTHNASSKADTSSKAAPNGTSAPANPTPPDSTSPINWTEQPLSLLHAYRHAYRLPIPSAFTNPNSQMMLTRGIGRHSPTAVASRRAKRALKALQTQSQPSTTPAAEKPSEGGKTDKGGFGGGKVLKEQLAMAVRRHFNAMGLNESDTIVRFAYVGSQNGREFRQRFRP